VDSVIFLLNKLCENKHRECVAVGPQKLRTQLPPGIIQTCGIIRILQTSWKQVCTGIEAKRKRCFPWTNVLSLGYI